MMDQARAPRNYVKCGDKWKYTGHLPLSVSQMAEDVWYLEHPVPTIDEAIDQAHLVIDEYYNGDRKWAERWLLRAYVMSDGSILCHRAEIGTRNDFVFEDQHNDAG